MDELEKCEANYVPLTPITFLKRASVVYANRVSVIYEATKFTWKQTYDRCCHLSSSLRSLDICKNDVVSVLAPNIPAMYEMHFAIPMAGAVLNAINTRLDANAIATILCHSSAKMLFVDYQYVNLAREALHLLTTFEPSPLLPTLVVIDDIDSPLGVRTNELEYEQLIRKRHMYEHDSKEWVQDEWDPIALNYTSGTTSSPKGVLCSHRGAYLSTLSIIMGWEMGPEPIYLWSLPMFHCNGWSLTWGVAARGGTNVCIRTTTARDIFRSIDLHNVTHMCCAPVVFGILLEAAKVGEYEVCGVNRRVNVLTGGAAPPPMVMAEVEELGFRVTHAYGLTEATGPALFCEWRSEWNELSVGDQCKLKARQGISTLTLSEADVKNTNTMKSVPHDGKTIGEITLKGSNMMKGYYKDRDSTAKSFKHGWFLTGDVAVIHPDGYIEIKDRSKDIIISGGENISTVELESVLYKHPRVSEAAVVAMPHRRWGESPCAFIVSKKLGHFGDVNESDIIGFCKMNLPRFMVPKKVVFLNELPKTSTGKIQKFELRKMVENLSDVKDEEKVVSSFIISRF